MQSYILTAAIWCNRDSPSYMQSLPFSKDKDHAPRVLLGATCYPSSHPSTSFIYHCFESQVSISQGVCSPQSMLIQDKFQPWTWVLLNLETNISNLVFIHLFFFFFFKQIRNYSLIKGWGRENLCSEDSFLFIHLDTKFKKHFPSILCVQGCLELVGIALVFSQHAWFTLSLLWAALSHCPHCPGRTRDSLFLGHNAEPNNEPCTILYNDI